MKTMITAFFALSMAFNAFATEGSTTIEESSLSTENQIAVATAIQKTCGYMGELKQIAPIQQIPDFQETGDVSLKITLSGVQRTDQYMTAEFMIYVDAVIPNIPSSRQDFVEVKNVRCELK